jgi:hypothetical protein
LVKKKYPYFWAIDPILSKLPNFNPPHVTQTISVPMSNVAPAPAPTRNVVKTPPPPEDDGTEDDEAHESGNDGSVHSDKLSAFGSDFSSDEDPEPDMSPTVAARLNIPTPTNGRTNARDVFKYPKAKKSTQPRRKSTPAHDASVREQVQLTRIRVMELRLQNEAREQEIRARQNELLMKLVGKDAGTTVAAQKAEEDAAWERKKAKREAEWAKREEEMDAEQARRQEEMAHYDADFEQEWIAAKYESRGMNNSEQPPSMARMLASHRRTDSGTPLPPLVPSDGGPYGNWGACGVRDIEEAFQKQEAARAEAARAEATQDEECQVDG